MACHMTRDRRRKVVWRGRGAVASGCEGSEGGCGVRQNRGFLVRNGNGDRSVWNGHRLVCNGDTLACGVGSYVQVRDRGGLGRYGARASFLGLCFNYYPVLKAGGRGDRPFTLVTSPSVSVFSSAALCLAQGLFYNGINMVGVKVSRSLVIVWIQIWRSCSTPPGLSGLAKL